MENWKIIKGYPDYAISDTGYVKSLRYDRILKASFNDGWYQHVNLMNNKKRKTWAIHRLVIEHFGPPYPEVYSIVDHIDGNKANNHINNLEWVTCSENNLHNYKIGLTSGHKRKITQYDLEMNKIKQFDTIKEASIMLNISYSCIKDVLKEKQKSSKGFIFKYLD